MDTIDRQAAIDAMRVINDSICEQQAVDALYDLPSAPRWIPCKERLPEEDKNVLVSVHFLGLDQKHKTGWNDHIKENWYVDIASHIDGYWTSYSDEYKVASNRHIIVAWTPLPEPWKGE